MHMKRPKLFAAYRQFLRLKKYTIMENNGVTSQEATDSGLSKGANATSTRGEDVECKAQKIQALEAALRNTNFVVLEETKKLSIA
ncbi:hypothetical protein MANES_02G038950v8 [Manihot esculenta]|uniref:Uncharacterized protein n=1 Tax=Manihot esculenta TaxID=3983 RepID=A0ACB7I5Y2_MANES|nr:hypothetical protein MANES_02G038950v8 [Manihot esculenta]